MLPAGTYRRHIEKRDTCRQRRAAFTGGMPSPSQSQPRSDERRATGRPLPHRPRRSCSARAGRARRPAPRTARRARAGGAVRAVHADHGVGDFPDPSAVRQITLDQVANGSSVNVNSPAFTQAISACKALEPTGFAGSRRSTPQQSAALKFAQCVRAHGVSDFPDPVNGQPLVDTNRIPSVRQCARRAEHPQRRDAEVPRRRGGGDRTPAVSRHDGRSSPRRSCSPRS